MLMTLPIVVSPVWVLDVCLDTAFNCGNYCQFVRTSTTYYDLGESVWYVVTVGSLYVVVCM